MTKLKSLARNIYFVLDGGIDDTSNDPSYRTSLNGYLSWIVSTIIMLAVLLGIASSIAATYPTLMYYPDTCDSPPCEPVSMHVFDTIDQVVVAIFLIEFLLRILTVWAVTASEARLSTFEWLINPSSIKDTAMTNIELPIWKQYFYFLTSIRSLVDIIIIISNYYYTAHPSPDAYGIGFVRVIRIFRIFRLFSIFNRYRKYSDISLVLINTLRSSFVAMSVLIFCVIIFMIFFGAIMYEIEKGVFRVTMNYPDGEYFHLEETVSAFSSIPVTMYYVTTTMTTVGYGDITPQTQLGRFVACFIMYCGAIFIALPFAIISSNFAEQYERYSIFVLEETYYNYILPDEHYPTTPPPSEPTPQIDLDPRSQHSIQSPLSGVSTHHTTITLRRLVSSPHVDPNIKLERKRRIEWYKTTVSSEDETYNLKKFIKNEIASLKYKKKCIKKLNRYYKRDCVDFLEHLEDHYEEHYNYGNTDNVGTDNDPIFTTNNNNNNNNNNQNTMFTTNNGSAGNTSMNNNQLQTIHESSELDTHVVYPSTALPLSSSTAVPSLDTRQSTQNISGRSNLSNASNSGKSQVSHRSNLSPQVSGRLTPNTLKSTQNKTQKRAKKTKMKGNRGLKKGTDADDDNEGEEEDDLNEYNFNRIMSMRNSTFNHEDDDDDDDEDEDDEEDDKYNKDKEYDKEDSRDTEGYHTTSRSNHDQEIKNSGRKSQPLVSHSHSHDTGSHKSTDSRNIGPSQILVDMTTTTQNTVLSENDTFRYSTTIPSSGHNAERGGISSSLLPPVPPSREYETTAAAISTSVHIETKSHEGDEINESSLPPPSTTTTTTTTTTTNTTTTSHSRPGESRESTLGIGTDTRVSFAINPNNEHKIDTNNNTASTTINEGGDGSLTLGRPESPNIHIQSSSRIHHTGIRNFDRNSQITLGQLEYDTATKIFELQTILKELDDDLKQKMNRHDDIGNNNNNDGTEEVEGGVGEDSDEIDLEELSRSILSIQKQRNEVQRQLLDLLIENEEIYSERTTMSRLYRNYSTANIHNSILNVTGQYAYITHIASNIYGIFDGDLKIPKHINCFKPVNTMEREIYTYCHSMYDITVTLVSIIIYGAIILGVLIYVISTVKELKYSPESCPDPACQKDPILCPSTIICEPVPLDAFNIIDFICVIIFTIDYLMRLFTCWSVPPEDNYVTPYLKKIDEMPILSAQITFAKNPKFNYIDFYIRYIISLRSVIDIASTLPGYLGVRKTFIRVLRVTRLLKIFYKSKFMLFYFEIIQTTFQKSKEALIILLFSSIMAAIIYGSIMYYLERGRYTDASPFPVFLVPSIDGTSTKITPFDSVLSGIYYTFVTLTTTGYGDLYPTTGAGRFFAIIVMLTAITMLSLPIGVLQNNFYEAFKKAEKKEKNRRDDERMRLTQQEQDRNNNIQYNIHGNTN